MKTQIILICTGLFALLSFGCTISEEERCAEGYTWDTTYRLCLQEKIDDSEKIDTEPQANGVGTHCFEDSDCTSLELEVNYCLIDPMSPETGGMCSVWECEAINCPGPYSCCDCTATGSPAVPTGAPFCLPIDYVSVVESPSVGCTCE